MPADAPSPQAPPPPPPPPGDSGKASGGMRALGVVVALVLAFAVLLGGLSILIGSI